MELKKSIGMASADAVTLARAMREIKVGEVVTYQQLSQTIARNVTREAQAALHTARGIVQREDRMVFDAVRGVGLKRLNDEEIVDLSDKARDHIRRTSRRTAKKLTCVDYDGMSRDKQVKHNTALSMLGVFMAMATEKSTRRLSEQVQIAGTDLPVAKASIAALGVIGQ